MTSKPMLAIGLAAAVVFAAGAAQAQSSTMPPHTNAQMQGKASKPDQRFLTEAIQGDFAEVQMGQLAQQKGGTEGVKAFGATLVKDHGEHADKVKQLAESLGVNLPSEPNATQKSEYARMSSLSGQRFDREFAPRMVSDHKKDISKYQMEAKRSGPVADMAKETVPVLQKHLQMAQSLSRPAPTTGSR